MATEPTYTKHIIGAVIDNKQSCIICGAELEDYTGQVCSSDSPGSRAWAEGEIYRTDSGNPMITTTIFPKGSIVNDCNKPA